MDLLAELESMAQMSVQQPDYVSDQPDLQTIEIWQALFNYDYAEAVRQINNKRADFQQFTISDEHWALVRTEMEDQGYDREAYEHFCWLQSRRSRRQEQPQPTKRASTTSATFLLKLEGPLADVEAVKAMGEISDTLPLHTATDEDGEVSQFCIVDARTRDKIIHHLAKVNPLFQPTLIRYSKARKDLDPFSASPTLNIDATMPQHRPNSENDPKLFPKQDQYPVWYFFYGTLADPVRLRRLLNFGDEPSYVSARVRGTLGLWAEKYLALTDAVQGTGDLIQGRAFQVESQDQEDSLRYYETDHCEVVRCEIEMAEGTVRGLTFRFIGKGDWAPLGS